LKRGDIVTIALQGDYGKPRPALIIQSDAFQEHPSVTVLPLTSDITGNWPLFRILIEPAEENGLKKPSHLMIDKVQTVPREKAGETIGHIQAETMIEVNRALAVFLGIA
jgi:mRNA interferase MazF